MRWAASDHGELVDGLAWRAAGGDRRPPAWGIAAFPVADPTAENDTRGSGVLGMVLGFAAISLLLRARSPMWLQSNFIVDYGLFGQLAGSLADHQWLGAFDGRNLVKGPSYSMFIYCELSGPHPDHDRRAAAVSVRGGGDGDGARSAWPQPMAWRRHVRGLAINPIHLGAVGSALIREVFYTSVSILLIGSVLLLVSFVPALARTRYGWGYAPLVSAADSPDWSQRPTTCAVRNERGSLPRY